MVKQEMKEKSRHILLNTLGIFFVVLGLVGVVTPVLPSTVFFIIASGLFLRSNKGIYRWLHRNRITGTYLRVYTEGQGLSRQSKAWSVGSLWASLGISGWIVREHWPVLAVLALVGIGVTWHIVSIKPRKISEARLAVHRQIMAGERLAG